MKLNFIQTEETDKRITKQDPILKEWDFWRNLILNYRSNRSSVKEQ